METSRDSTAIKLFESLPFRQFPQGPVIAQGFVLSTKSPQAPQPLG